MSSVRCDRDVEHARLASRVENTDQRAVMCARLSQDNGRGVRVLRMHALDIRAYRPQIDRTAIDEDSIRAADLDDDALLFLFLFLLLRIRPRQIDTRLFGEGRCNDEEDQHDEDDVEHRRHVDLGLVL